MSKKGFVAEIYLLTPKKKKYECMTGWISNHFLSLLTQQDRIESLAPGGCPFKLHVSITILSQSSSFQRRMRLRKYRQPADWERCQVSANEDVAFGMLLGTIRSNVIQETKSVVLYT